MAQNSRLGKDIRRIVCSVFRGLNRRIHSSSHGGIFELAGLMAHSL